MLTFTKPNYFLLIMTGNLTLMNQISEKAGIHMNDTVLQPQSKNLWILATLLAYVALFISAFQASGLVIAALSIVPVLIAGYLTGKHLIPFGGLARATGPDEYVMRKKNKTMSTAELSRAAFHTGGKNKVHGMVRDIGEHKQVEVRLGNSREQLKELVAAKTAELHMANRQLKEEIHDRLLAEQEVQALNVELEKRVAERTSRLEAANKELESFSFAVSHDLRSPLTSIIGFSNALLDDCGAELCGAGQNYLQRIIAASDRMQGQIDALLNFSRMVLSKLTITNVNLSEVAREVANDLALASPREGVKIIIGEGLTADADKVLVRTVLDNLMGNAWKYTSKKAQAIIEFGAREIGGETVFFVADNGAGFNMEHAGKLFEPFQRLHRIDEFEGNGIGLMTVKRIIRHHGGRVWAEAAVDTGATFYFTIGWAESHEI